MEREIRYSCYNSHERDRSGMSSVGELGRKEHTKQVGKEVKEEQEGNEKCAEERERERE
jgi:hypothetical protein